MRHVARWVAFLLLGALLTIPVAGCTVLGYASGAIWDIHKPKTKLVPTGRTLKFRVDDRLVLYLEDSTQVEGKYEGTARVPKADYVARYEQWRENEAHASDLPAIGERIELLDARGVASSRGGLFAGFYRDGIELSGKRHRQSARFDKFAWIKLSNGRNEELKLLRTRAIAGDLPLTTALQLRTSNGRRVVPLDQVSLVRMPTHPGGATTGFLIGLGVDATIVALELAVEIIPALKTGL